MPLRTAWQKNLADHSASTSISLSTTESMNFFNNFNSGSTIQKEGGGDIVYRVEVACDDGGDRICPQSQVSAVEL